MSNLVGQPGPHAQPPTYGRNDAGQFATIFFEDVDPKKIDALAFQFDAARYNYTVEHGFGKSKITVQMPFIQTSPGNPAEEQPVDLWEYNAITAQKDIIDSHVPSGLTNNLTPKQKQALKSVIATKPGFDPSDTGNLSNDFTLPAAWINVFGAQDPTSNADCAACAAVYAVVADGVDTFEQYVPVLRHTQTVSVQYDMHLPMENIGLILSQAKLLKEGAITASIANNLPTFTQDGSNKKWGWKKFFPTIQQIAFRKIQYIQEYQFGQWDTRVYGPLIEPSA